MEASVGEQLAANRAHSRSGRWQMQQAGSQRFDEHSLFLPIVGKRMMQEVARGQPNGLTASCAKTRLF